MVGKGEEFKAISKLEAMWSATYAQLKQMKMSAEVKPDNGWDLFKAIQDHDHPNEVCIGLNPMVINVPERADDTSMDMFIVLTGRMTFDRARLAADELLTLSFSTEAGYFRMRHDGSLRHEYGAHYDFSLNEAGHPVFHAQMKNMINFGSNIRDYLGDDQIRINDGIPNLLATVRLPCAQMDMFAFILQICADHLIAKSAQREVKVAFNELVITSTNIKGAAHRCAHVTRDAVRNCLRSYHWYPTA